MSWIKIKCCHEENVHELHLEFINFENRTGLLITFPQTALLQGTTCTTEDYVNGQLEMYLLVYICT